MPRRIMIAKQEIKRGLDQAQINCQNDLGMGISEFTKLVLEVLDERSEAFILKLSKEQQNGSK